MLDALAKRQPELWLERPLGRELPLKAYRTRADAMLQRAGGALGTRRVAAGTAHAVHFRPPAAEQLPKGARPGDALAGDVAYAYAALAPGDALPGDAPPGDAAAGGEGDAARATRAVLSRQRVARLAAVRAQKLALEREEALLLA